MPKAGLICPAPPELSAVVPVEVPVTVAAEGVEPGVESELPVEDADVVAAATLAEPVLLTEPAVITTGKSE